uniref:Secreted protein n=1 Tax=Steinernema glaseri TaxID=37863 RepID=A0A1I7Y5G3_9BILA
MNAWMRIKARIPAAAAAHSLRMIVKVACLWNPLQRKRFSQSSKRSVRRSS